MSDLRQALDEIAMEGQLPNMNNGAVPPRPANTTGSTATPSNPTQTSQDVLIRQMQEQIASLTARLEASATTTAPTGTPTAPAVDTAMAQAIAHEAAAQAAAQATADNEAAALVAAQRAAVPANDQPARIKHAAPKLSKFTGQREHYESWKMEAEGKLLIDGLAIGDDQAQLGYLFASMEPDAQNAVKGIYRECRNGRERALSMIAYMDRRYLDPNAAQNALEKLSTMRQPADQSFVTWFPKFEAVLYEADAESSSQAQKINYLRQALNYDMRDRMIGPVIYASYQDFVTMAYTVDAALTSLKSHKRLTAEPFKATPFRSPAAPPPYGAFRANKASPTASDRVRWVDEKEQKRRYDAGLCLRCGKAGHRIAECPQRPARRPDGVRIRQASVGEEEETSDQTEKE